MESRFQKILSLLLILAFLAPWVIKLEHRHHIFVCKAVHEKHLHSQPEKCISCAFEFAWFSISGSTIIQIILNFIGFEPFRPRQLVFIIHPEYTFDLRAPPFLQNQTL